jgi:hypothetical protein
MALMPYDAGNRKDVRAAEKQAKLAEQQRREIVTGIMSVAPGRSWMCDILESCHIFATSYNDIPGRMAFMEGQREVGIRLLTDIMGACPDQYVLMMRERNERNSAYDARRSRQDTNGRDRQPDPNDGDRDDSPDLYDADGDAVSGEPVR